MRLSAPLVLAAMAAMAFLAAPAIARQMSDAEIRQAIIQQSMANHPGQCACPYNLGRNGNACGRFSVYSRSGGRSLLCYPRDITKSMVDDYRQSHGIAESVPAPNRPDQGSQPTSIEPLRNRPTIQLVCSSLKQTMDDLKSGEDSLSNAAKTIDQEISSLAQAVLLWTQQIVQLNQEATDLQHAIQALQQDQQALNDAASVAQGLGQGDAAASLRTAAKTLDSIIGHLQNQESICQAQLQLLQALIKEAQQRIENLSQSLHSLQEKIAQLSADWRQDNTKYNEQCG